MRPDEPQPLLSVVIPTHDRRELVVRAIDSVLAQQGPLALQVVVVDDASTDGTAAALQARHGADPRVEILASTQRRHASGARNLGFARARGEFVCFLDSDDAWQPGLLAAVAAVFARHPPLAFVAVDGSTLGGNGRAALARIVAGDSPGWSHARFAALRPPGEPFELPHGGGDTMLMRGDFLPAIAYGDLFYLSGMVMRRDCAAAAGPFNERFHFFNDWEFFARLCLQGSGAYLDFDGFRRDSGRADQISRRRPVTAMARRHLFIAHALLRSGHPRAGAHRDELQRALADAQYRMARCLLVARQRRRAVLYLYTCIQKHYKAGRCLLLWTATRLGWRGGGSASAGW